jgi:cyclopropane fatty-acyl-phospholipid synthase-like methyltransferase
VREGSRLLDIGCGDGFFTKRFFATRCAHIDTVDNSARDIAQTNA